MPLSLTVKTGDSPDDDHPVGVHLHLLGKLADSRHSGSTEGSLLGRSLEQILSQRCCPSPAVQQACEAPESPLC